VGLGAAIGKPAIVAASQRKRNFRTLGGFHQKERRVDDLHFGAHRIHIAKPRLHIQ
jgi:hypothetical protein